MSTRTKLVIAAIAALSLVCAAVAVAATPKEGTYRGKTSQGRNLRVKVNSNHNIPGEGFRINWHAPCTVQTDHRWGPERTENSGKIDVDDDGSFKLNGSYDSEVGDYVGHIKIRNSGRFNSRTTASGEFKVTVRVTKDGDEVDTCRKTVKWSVKKV